MRCKTCDYLLWNLKSRRCPECGTDFRVSDYEFVPSSVQFCCPHCNQAYYGSSPKGLLVPEAFPCVTCNQPVQMNEMILLPAEGLDEEQTQTFRVPWLERHKRSRVRVWFCMIGLAMVHPGKLAEALPGESRAAPAWWFMLVTNWLTISAMVLPITFFMLLPQLLGGRPRPRMLFPLLTGPLMMLFLGPIYIAISVAIWGVITHVLLRLTGKTMAGPSRTWQCLCYSSGANILAIVVCFPYVGLVWWIVSAVLMVQEAQRVSGRRAALAVLTLPILAGSTLIGLNIWLIMIR